jgi:Leucine-rich repeat (LRR) protein
MFSTSNWTSLLNLEIKFNRFQSIDTNKTNWNHFPKLKILNLANNRLKYLKQDSFKGLTTVEELSLRGNQLNKFSPTWLRDFVNLTLLHLSNNNLSFLPTNAFQNLKNLQSLHLNGNRIKHIFASMWPKNIQILFLSNNEITNLNSDQFVNLTSLEELGLDNNKISEISNCTFCGMSNLRILRINENPLSISERRWFDGLTNKNLSIYTNDTTFSGPMNPCSENCNYSKCVCGVQRFQTS